jgi:hypothetical protein
MDLMACLRSSVMQNGELIELRYQLGLLSLVRLEQYLSSSFSRSTSLPTSRVKPATKSSQLIERRHINQTHTYSEGRCSH